LGIYVVYYLDYTVGGAWWIIFLYLIQIVALFAIRGRPHSGEAVVAELFPPSGRYLKYWAAPLLSFTWTVVLPLTLVVSQFLDTTKLLGHSQARCVSSLLYSIGSEYYSIQERWLLGIVFLSSHEQRLLGCMGKATWNGDSTDTDTHNTGSVYHTGVSVLE